MSGPYSKKAYVDIAHAWSERIRGDMERLIIRFLESQGTYSQKQMEAQVREISENLSSSVIKSCLELTKQAIEAHIEERIDGMDISDAHKEDYKAAFLVEEADDILMIAFYTNEFVIEGLENGAAPFSMKEGLLQKGKMSKAGNRYRVIPVESEDFAAKAKRSPSPKRGNFLGELYQDQIKAVIQKLKGKYKLMSETEDPKTGEYTRVESIEMKIGEGRRKKTKIADRVRRFESRQAFSKRHKTIYTGYIQLKTVSEAEGSADWYHPGFTANNVMEDTAEWAVMYAMDLMNKMVAQIRSELGG